MNREIKFRIWNERYRQFSYWGFIERGFHGISTGSGLTIEECHQLSQQFTGLLDKNGKEIYEGDLLKWDLDHEPLEVSLSPHAVSFYKGAFYMSHQPGVVNDILSDYTDEVEVIGNIYENPDLLQ